jgi:hypothetical protein
MVTKIIMDSGKEYIVEESPEEILEKCYSDTKLPTGDTIKAFANKFIQFDNNTIICSMHISSLEIIEDIENIKKIDTNKKLKYTEIDNHNLETPKLDVKK